jgi:tRNA threonylcarbamoyladenosine biosynthesis protein TsaB
VRDAQVLADVSEPSSRSHTGSLPLLIEAALARAGLGWDAIDGLAVSIGPGSFTGLRIGLSVAKGIAYAGGLPIAAVPTLAAVAAATTGSPGEIVWAALDARMREVYAASFVRTSDGLERRTPDEALPPDALAARLTPGIVLVGDAVAAYPALARADVRVVPLEACQERGSVVARLGARALARGETADIGTLAPCYVRASQAELAKARPSR